MLQGQLDNLWKVSHWSLGVVMGRIVMSGNQLKHFCSLSKHKRNYATNTKLRENQEHSYQSLNDFWLNEQGLYNIRTWLAFFCAFVLRLMTAAKIKVKKTAVIQQCCFCFFSGGRADPVYTSPLYSLCWPLQAVKCAAKSLIPLMNALIWQFPHKNVSIWSLLLFLRLPPNLVKNRG